MVKIIIPAILLFQLTADAKYFRGGRGYASSYLLPPLAPSVACPASVGNESFCSGCEDLDADGDNGEIGTDVVTALAYWSDWATTEGNGRTCPVTCCCNAVTALCDD